jgi:hypothetical protein
VFLSVFIGGVKTGTAVELGAALLSSWAIPKKYGPGNEACTTSGIVLKASDNWQQRIENAMPGEVLLLRAGVYTLTDTLVLPSGKSGDPIVLKPYKCEPVRIFGVSSTPGKGMLVKPGSYNTIAGLRIESASHEKLMDIAGNTRDVEFRNNTLYGGKGDAISIRGRVKSIVFKGNDINSGPAQLPGLTGSSGGHVFQIALQGTGVPDGVHIIRNKIRGSYFGDRLAGDDTIAVSGGNDVVIEENWFTEQYNIEQVIDIKSRFSNKPVIVRGNLFENNFLGTRGGQDTSRAAAQYSPEITIGDHDSPNSLLQHVIEYNRFQRGVSVGPSSRPGSALIRSNVIHALKTSKPWISFVRVYDTLIVNNTFYRGGFKIGRHGVCVVPRGELTFKNNIFYETFVLDQTKSCPSNQYTFVNNVLYGLSSAIGKAAQYLNNFTADPYFINASDGDFRLKTNSLARLAGEGEVAIGAFLP